VTDECRGPVISTALDPSTLADAIAHREKPLKDPDFDPCFSRIIGYPRISGSHLQADDVRRLGQKWVFCPESRRAIAVSNNPSYGVGGMFEMLRKNPGENGTRVFPDRVEALDSIVSDRMSA
jgi:hypothetical protein